jgi:TatD DNase family protein
MFDSHTHLQDERFDTCRQAVLDAARTAGVTGTCCCGSSASDWLSVARLAASLQPQSREGRARPPDAPSSATGAVPAALGASGGSGGPALPLASMFRILPAFGVHPWYAGEQPADWLARLEEHLVAHPEAPAGEIGIDGLRDDLPRDVQRQVLLAQLELAARLNRPVVLHGARAWGELLALVKPFAARLPGFVVHAFSGSQETLREIIALGGHVSFAGIVCNPEARRARAAAAAVPLEKLLIETDAPDLLPRGVDGGRWTVDGGKPEGKGSGFGVQGSTTKDGPRPSSSHIPPDLNHPANLVLVARAVAELRKTNPEEIAARTAANAGRVYGLQRGA